MLNITNLLFGLNKILVIRIDTICSSNGTKKLNTIFVKKRIIRISCWVNDEFNLCEESIFKKHFLW